jgi:hypothetical protein
MSTITETIDETRVQEFAGRLFGIYTGAMLSAMIDIGYRTGLFEAAAQGPASSPELAIRAGLHERYVREWLGSMATSGIVEYDAASETVPAAGRTRGVPHRRWLGESCAVRSTQHTSGHAC